jgi:hypothetical protein
MCIKNDLTNTKQVIISESIEFLMQSNKEYKGPSMDDKLHIQVTIPTFNDSSGHHDTSVF